ncbi:MAG: precorrin-8X methylmutase [Deltaproteobacteria bacterium]|jgi:precorrin-8X/cobalt-precorrin-8 methylmutase|nr:precorrin-8X methylmutase [Deltaproteobacteria bacterium]
MTGTEWKLKPSDIEAKSFSIIDAEAGAHDWDPRSWQLVRRLIHTSADFDYVKDTVISPGAIEAGIQALNDGSIVLTDTNMALSGINLRRLGNFGNTMACLVDDIRVINLATKTGMTRSMAAVDVGFSTISHQGQPEGAIWVFGNAPTGLFRLLERVKNDPSLPTPRLVVGLPVGFVNALESKKALIDSGLPYFITNRGRKGGSNVAAATINALSALAREECSLAQTPGTSGSANGPSSPGSPKEPGEGGDS